MPPPSRDRFTYFSPRLIQFPALCAGCGAPTGETTTVAIEATETVSFIHALLTFLPVPGLRFARLAWDVGRGANSAEIPCCKKCSRSTSLAVISAFLFLLPCFGMLYILNAQMVDLPMWLIWTCGAFATASLVMFFISWKTRRQIIGITRRNGGYEYHFYSGIYPALAAHPDFNPEIPARSQ